MFKPHALKVCLEKTLDEGVLLSFIAGSDGRLVAYAGDTTQAKLLSALVEFTKSVYSRASESNLKMIMMETRDKKVIVAISVVDFVVCFVGKEGCNTPLVCKQAESFAKGLKDELNKHNLI